MSYRVTIDGRSSRRSNASLVPFHRPVRKGARCIFPVEGRPCGRLVYFVATGGIEEGTTGESGAMGYYRHEPDTFWSSR